MNEAAAPINATTQVDWLGRTIETHWNTHAMVMVSIWVVLVPLCITIMRFYKPPPAEKGIRRDVSVWHREWLFFGIHKFGLFFAMFLFFAAAAYAYVASHGFSGSVHAYFGTMTVVMGTVQIISSQMRGTRGGKYRVGADPDNPDTWRGDQYDRTPKRRMFEAVHKTCGYFAVMLAIGAIGSGLMQFPMPLLTIAFIAISGAWLVVWVVHEFNGKAYDGYRVAHGYGVEHPYNKKREFL